eukprot:scaffold10.g2361.t1
MEQLPGAALGAAPPSTDGFSEWLNAGAASLDGTVDAVHAAANMLTLARNWELTGFVLYLLVDTAVLALGALWRRKHWASYLQWREAYAIGLRFAMFLPSAWWDHSTRMLAQPSWTTCGGLNAAIMTGSLLFVTGTAPGVVIALCRPVRLWLHLAAQAVVLAASLPHSGGLCRTPSFQHHTAERMFGRAYALLDWLGLLTPLPTSLLVQHGPQGRCKCVVGATALFLGFWMPVLVAAVAEARAFWRWQLEGCPRARGGGGCAAAAKCSTLGGAPSAARGVRRCGAQVQACVQAVQRRVYSEAGRGRQAQWASGDSMGSRRRYACITAFLHYLKAKGGMWRQAAQAEDAVTALKQSITNWAELRCAYAGAPARPGRPSHRSLLQCPGCRVKARGTLPPELASMQDLETLNVQQQALGGTLPPEWGAPGAFPHLLNLVVRDTPVRGSVPPSWGAPGALRSLVLLSLADAPLDGPLPDPLLLPALSILRIFNTRVSGTLSPALGTNGSLPAVRVLALQNNSLEGPLPPEWASPEALNNLEELYLQLNQITGGLPPEWQPDDVWPRLRVLNLSNNPLGGPLPAEWMEQGSFPALQVLHLSATNLTGPLPDVPATPASEGGNSSTPATGLAALGRLWIDGNDLSGSIPPSWANLTKLQQLYVRPGNERLCGGVPAGAVFRLCNAQGGLECSMEASLDSSDYCKSLTAPEPTTAAVGPSTAADSRAAAAPPPAADTSGSGTSPGVIAAAVLGSTLGVAAAAALFVAARRQRRRKRGAGFHTQPASPKSVAPGNASRPASPSSRGDLELAALDAAFAAEGVASPFAALVHEPPHGDDPAPPPALLVSGAHVPAAVAAAQVAEPSPHLALAQLPRPMRDGSRRLSSRRSSLNSWLSCMFRQGSAAPPAADEELGQAGSAGRGGPAALPPAEPPPQDTSSEPSLQTGSPSVELSQAVALSHVASSASAAAAAAGGAVHSPSLEHAPASARQSEGSAGTAPDEAAHTGKHSFHRLTREGCCCHREVSTIEVSDWEISSDEIEICRRPDGSEWELGTGGFGRVYKALRNHAQPVAVLNVASYEVRSLAQTDFMREVSILRACRDPNIVLFLGACLSEDRSMLVTEYCEGGNLTRNLMAGRISWYNRGAKARGWGEVLGIGIGIGRRVGVQQACEGHSRLATNILLARDGTAKIADVGMARIIAGGFSGVSGQIGTLAWAAPELLLGARCTEKADIYSFGVLLWEICTRTTPVRGQLRDVHCPDECPQEVRDVILSCLATNPRKRPTAVQLAQRLSLLATQTRPAAAAPRGAALGRPPTGASAQRRGGAAQGRAGAPQPLRPSFELQPVTPESSTVDVPTQPQQQRQAQEAVTPAQQRRPTPPPPPTGPTATREPGAAPPVRPSFELHPGTPRGLSLAAGAPRRSSEEQRHSGASRIASPRSPAAWQLGRLGLGGRSESIANYEAMPAVGSKRLSDDLDERPLRPYASVAMGPLFRAWGGGAAELKQEQQQGQGLSQGTTRLSAGGSSAALSLPLQQSTSLDAEAVRAVAVAWQGFAAAGALGSGGGSGGRSRGGRGQLARQSVAAHLSQMVVQFAQASGGEAQVSPFAAAAGAVPPEPDTPTASPFAAMAAAAVEPETPVLSPFGKPAAVASPFAAVGAAGPKPDTAVVSPFAAAAAVASAPSLDGSEAAALAVTPPEPSSRRASGASLPPQPSGLRAGRRPSAASGEAVAAAGLAGPAAGPARPAVAPATPPAAAVRPGVRSGSCPELVGEGAGGGDAQPPAGAPVHRAASLSRCLASALGSWQQQPARPTIGSPTRLPPLHEQFFL